jgi:serine/threonine-protein kinase
VDEVIGQDPDAGELAEEGSSVVLDVSRGVKETTVPDLTGMTKAEAREALDEANLRLGTAETAPSDEFEEGQVISQDPAPNSEVPVRDRVNITLSSGPEVVEVPSVEGLAEADAVSAIQAAGLLVNIERAPSDSVEEGIVISQDPAGGAEATASETVTIVVSEGPETQALPDVTGQNADDAEAQLEALGLDVSQEEETEPCTQPEETVCRTSPAPGSAVAPGDEVILFVQSS